jgi:hypothetical protein
MNICIDCGHRHRGQIECAFCKCGHLEDYEKVLVGEDTMIKKAIKWVWNIICWPWRKLVDWIWSR